MQYFNKTCIRSYEIPRGFMVCFLPIWGPSGDQRREAERQGVDVDALYSEFGVLVSVDPYILEVNPQTVTDIDGQPFVRCGSFIQPAIPEVPPDELDRIEPGEDHDLRSRTFETRKEAEIFHDYTVNRWKHPEPRESFATISGGVTR